MSSKRVWIYGRAASDEEALKRQEKILVSYARDSGFQVTGITMKMESGSPNSIVREGVKEIFEAARKGEMDFVLVADQTRLFWDADALHDFQNRLQGWGVGIISWADVEKESAKQIYSENLSDIYSKLGLS